MGLTLFAVGYYIGNEDMKQWGVISALTGLVIVIAGREISRGRILGPNEKEEAFEILRRIFRNAQDFVKLVDSWPGPDTLRAIDATPEGIHIQFLAFDEMSKKSVESFERAAAELKQTRNEMEIRYMPKGSFHDRFILTKPHGWHLGASLKDSGNKITRIGPMAVDETARVVERFDFYWPQSRPVP